MEKLNGTHTGSEVNPQIVAPGFDGSYLSLPDSGRPDLT